MAWCFENQSDDYTRAILSKLERDEALVPLVWPLEVANSLVVGERRRKITRAASSSFVSTLAGLPIFVEEDTRERALGPILDLARDQNLSAYDAAYVDVALREGLPLATRDESLIKAAKVLGLRLALR